MASAEPTQFPVETITGTHARREPAQVSLRLTVVEPAGRWRMEEKDVPESPRHDAITQLLMLILKHWAARAGRPVLVASNLGCRWDPEDARVGTDPDLVVVDPAPPEGEAMTTLRVWEPGHAPPRVAVEVVSEHGADKDYIEAPMRCALLGARELWVFDPLLLGPSETGGPFRLQVWRRTREGNLMDRAYAGPGPARSEELGAWLVVTDGGARLRIADDPEGLHLWHTPEEDERDRAERERDRAERERERAEKAERRSAELEEELRNLKART